jgi:hypothetical protein
VPAANLHFFGFPDHESVVHLRAIHDRMSALFGDGRIAEITSPAYEGGNIDHDVAAFTAAAFVAANSRPITHYEFALYNRLNGRRQIGLLLPNSGAPILRLPLEGESRTLVEDSLKVYRSQRFLLKLLEISGNKKAVFDRGELFRRAGPYDYLKRPMNEPCGYEVSGRHRALFANWQAAVESFYLAQPALRPDVTRLARNESTDGIAAEVR